MNDPREELGPYWFQIATPFGMAPQPPGSPPRLGWGVRPINQALLAMWDSSKIPIPPAQPPWFPPAAPSADRPTPSLEHLDSAKYWGGAPATSVGNSQPYVPGGGILGDFGRSTPSSLDTLAAPTSTGGILGDLGANTGPSMQGFYPWQPSPSSWAPIPPPMDHLDSAKHWGGTRGPSGAGMQPSMSDTYLSRMPQAPSWDSVPANAMTASPPQLFAAPPSPTSWGSPYRNATDHPPADEAALVQEAYVAAARRLERGVRGRATAPYEPPARDPEADAAEPGLVERIRLNGMDSFYRGSLTGAGRLALMQHYASTPDEAGTDPQTKRWRDQLRKEYPQVLADLARYDRMQRFENPLEFGAAAIGQLGGGLPSPESLFGASAKGASLLWRLAKAGLQQGAINAATDPIVQGLNMRAGVQGQFDPWRPLIAGGAGFVTGAGARSASEFVGRGGPRARDSGTIDAATGDRGMQLFGPPAADEPKSGEWRTANMYAPPEKPPRPFRRDYPSGAPTDESGRLLTDMDGRPLTAKYIAGRRTGGGRDVGLEPHEIHDLIENAMGRPVDFASHEDLGGRSGAYLPKIDENGRPAQPEIWINEDLIPQQKEFAVAHEGGHMAEDLAVGPNGMSIQGLKPQLEFVYSALNSGKERRQPLLLPKDKDYSESDAPFELVAEAIRAYLTNPNYFKTFAPDAAAAIRAMVNSHPQLAKWIQFNGLGGLAALRGGIGGTSNDDPNSRRQRIDERTWGTDQ
jgi:hypothetical protein